MLFFERYSLVLDALLITPNLALKSNDLLLGFFGISFAVLAETSASYILMSHRLLRLCVGFQFKK